jgi:hypothetical protein
MPLLRLLQTGIAPEGIRGAEDDDLMPARAGVVRVTHAQS